MKSTAPRGGAGNGTWEVTVDHPESITRAVIAAHRLYHHAVKCDDTGRYQMARVMWAKYAEIAPRASANHASNLMRFTHQRLL